MYVMITPQTLELRPTQEIKHAPLVVSDYPTDPGRLLALYNYYRYWGSRAFPFLDQRVVSFIPYDCRDQFVRFTNLFYHSLMRLILKSANHLNFHAGGMATCDSCRKREGCEILCLAGLQCISIRYFGLNNTARTWISRETADRYDPPNSPCVDRGVGNYRVRDFYHIVGFNHPFVARATPRREPVDITNNVPLDQEEWWVE